MAERKVISFERGPVDDERQIMPHEDPREMPLYTEAQIQAVRAVNAGRATPDQQRKAMEYIVNHVSGYYDIAFRRGDPEASLVAEGKRIVGAHIVYLVKYAKVKTDIGAQAARAEGEQPS